MEQILSVWLKLSEEQARFLFHLVMMEIEEGRYYALNPEATPEDADLLKLARYLKEVSD